MVRRHCIHLSMSTNLFHIIMLAGFCLTCKGKSNIVQVKSSQLQFGGETFETLIKRIRRETSDHIVTIPLNDELRQEFVNIHNRYRRMANPPASNIREVSWDKDLEELAINHSKNCDYENHRPEDERITSQFSRVGENIARGTATISQAGEYFIKAWYDEISDYTFSDGSCTPGKPCGHYTQLVWWESYKVGCGISYCRNLLQGGYTGNIYVCNYGPGGNTQLLNSDGTSTPVQPYSAGSPCSACDERFPFCNNGLCSTSASAIEVSTMLHNNVSTAMQTTGPTALSAQANTTAKYLESITESTNGTVMCQSCPEGEDFIFCTKANTSLCYCEDGSILENVPEKCMPSSARERLQKINQIALALFALTLHVGVHLWV